MPSITDRVLGAFGLQRAFNPFLPGELERILGGGYYYPQTTMGNNKQEPIGQGFQNLVLQAYATNPIVFSVENARVQLFSEARFQFQKMRDGRPGELFNTPSTYLRLLDEPWPGGTTSALLKDMLIDADFAGTSFTARRPDMLQRLRPDWVTIISGSENPKATIWDRDVQILGFGYQPGGPAGGQETIYFQREEVALFKTVPDPLRRFSGMSWLIPVLSELNSDAAATAHMQRFWENAATPNLAIQYDINMTLDAVKKWVEEFKRNHEGAENAYKTLFLGGGATTVPVGANLQEADLSNVRSGGELRIASAAGVPPIVVGLSGGLDAATYSNYGQARRAFSDLIMRALWRDVCGALKTITSIPESARLWYDDRDISFLQEDMKDAAEIQSVQTTAIRTLVDAGFEPESAIAAIRANDFTRLTHTGLYSVQLQPPGTQTPSPETPVVPEPPSNATNAGRAWADVEIRCPNCDRLQAKRTAPGGGFEVKCRGCSTLVTA